MAYTGLQTEKQCDCCGLDITARLLQFKAQMEVEFKRAPKATKEAACYRMFGFGEAWDILELYKPNDTFTSGQCGAGECKGTVQVNGGCFLAGEVNYYLWGLANRLCSEHFYGNNPSPAVAAVNRWGYDQAVYTVAYYRSVKTFGGFFGNGISGQVAWTKAGYKGGFPSSNMTVDKLHGLHCGKCTKGTAGLPYSDGIYKGTLTGYFGSEYLVLGFLWRYDVGRIEADVGSGTHPMK